MTFGQRRRIKEIIADELEVLGQELLQTIENNEEDWKEGTNAHASVVIQGRRIKHILNA